MEDLAPEVLILVCDHACDSGECVFGTTYLFSGLGATYAVFC